MKKIFKIIILSICTLALFSSCASYSVDRISENENIDLSGNWNDTDIRIVTSALIDQCLSSQWINNYRIKNIGNYPTVIVGRISNKSSEHLDTTIISKKVEVALVNSGQVRTVADFDNKDLVRAEKLDQQYNASSETAAELGEEYGADYMLQGSVKINVDQIGGKMVKTYYVDLELVDIESNIKVWLGSDTVKKYISMPKYRF